MNTVNAKQKCEVGEPPWFFRVPFFILTETWGSNLYKLDSAVNVNRELFPFQSIPEKKCYFGSHLILYFCF